MGSKNWLRDIRVPDFSVHTFSNTIQKKNNFFSPRLFNPRLFSPELYSPRRLSPELFSPRPFSPKFFSPRLYSSMEKWTFQSWVLQSKTFQSQTLQSKMQNKLSSLRPNNGSNSWITFVKLLSRSYKMNIIKYRYCAQPSLLLFQQRIVVFAAWELLA